MRRGNRHGGDVDRHRHHATAISSPPRQRRHRHASAAVSAATARAISTNAARNAFTNALANTGKGTTSAGAAVSTSKETMIPLAAFSHFGPGNTPLSVNHQGLFVASTISFNLAAGEIARRGGRRDQCSDAPASTCRPPSPARMAGTAQLFQQSLSKEPILILTRDRRRLHPARRSVRELHPPDHHSLDAAVGRRRRAAGAHAVPRRVQHHRFDRGHSPDRHRQEERDHDDRFRHRGETLAQSRIPTRRFSRRACCASARS